MKALWEDTRTEEVTLWMPPDAGTESRKRFCDAHREILADYPNAYWIESDVNGQVWRLYYESRTDAEVDEPIARIDR